MVPLAIFGFEFVACDDCVLSCRDMMGSKKYGRAFFFGGKREREDVHPLGIMEWNSYGCGSACVYLSDLGL